MYRINEVLEMLDVLLSTKRKRHLIGGICLSMAMMFGGLATTVFTLKTEVDDEKRD